MSAGEANSTARTITLAICSALGGVADAGGFGCSASVLSGAAGCCEGAACAMIGVATPLTLSVDSEQYQYHEQVSGGSAVVTLRIFRHDYSVAEISFRLALWISARIAAAAAAGSGDCVMGRPTTSMDAPDAMACAGGATRLRSEEQTA